jgi:flagellar M-ring protein FliF
MDPGEEGDVQNPLTVWTALDARRRLVVGLATVATVLAVLFLARIAAPQDTALLYSGLEPAAAGEVVQALDQQGVAYEVRGSSIFVPAGRRDALRLTLAGQGLPANSVRGYELLDSLSGFGTTAQMFDAAYWRAKEGELARTITAAPDVQSARVHIANPSSSPFQRDMAATAAVTVTASGAIDSRRAVALRYLVASAVAGLDPADVSVIDGRTGFVVAGDEASGAAGNAGDRAEALRRNIQRLLEARVGPGNAVVEVNVETVTEREQISERRIDPETRVAISEAVEERAASSQEERGGAVTVASNLPDGEASTADGEARSNDTETRETINYEVSETRREVLREPGAVRRVSVAVLVDGLRTTDPETGAPVWTARSDEELEALRDLVASAVGYEPSRGDEITLRSMEFRATELPEVTAADGWAAAAELDLMRLIQLGVLAAVALALGLFVVRPALAARAPALAATAPTTIGLTQGETVTAANLPVPSVRTTIHTADVMPEAGATRVSLSREIAHRNMASDDRPTPADGGEERIRLRASGAVPAARTDPGARHPRRRPGRRGSRDPPAAADRGTAGRDRRDPAELDGRPRGERLMAGGPVLEDFATLAGPAAQAPSDPAPALADAERLAAYEQGYRAGWDDAVRAEAADQARIGAELARNLQEMSFSFHEARSRSSRQWARCSPR